MGNDYLRVILYSFYFLQKDSTRLVDLYINSELISRPTLIQEIVCRSNT
jgi:hypothetical protein